MLGGKVRTVDTDEDATVETSVAVFRIVFVRSAVVVGSVVV